MSISGAMENFKKLPSKQVIMMYKASRAVWCPGEQRDSKVLNTPDANTFSHQLKDEVHSLLACLTVAGETYLQYFRLFDVQGSRAPVSQSFV